MKWKIFFIRFLKQERKERKDVIFTNIPFKNISFIMKGWVVL